MPQMLTSLLDLPLSISQSCYRDVAMPAGSNSSCNVIIEFVSPKSYPQEKVLWALAVLCKRHDGLRTYFNADPPTQQATLDASGMEPDRLEAATQLSSYQDFLTVADFSRAKRLEFAETVIDPLVWPLFRIASFGESDDGQAFVLCAHHLIADAHALEVFVSQFLGILNGSMSVGRARIAETTYWEYARWQRREREAVAARAARDVWLDRFGTIQRYTSLGAASATGRSHGVLKTLEPGTAGGVRRLARASGASVLAVILAGYGIALRRHFDVEPVLAVPVLARPLEAHHSIIGCCALLAVVYPATEGRAKALVASANECLAQLRRCSTFSILDLEARLGIGRPSGRYPVTTLILNQKFVLPSEGALPSESPRDLGREIGFDLQLRVKRMGDNIMLDYIYRSDVLADDTVVRFHSSVDRELRRLVSG